MHEAYPRFVPFPQTKDLNSGALCPFFFDLSQCNPATIG